MRNSLTSSVRRLAAGWFWPLVLLALPNCGFSVTAGTGHNLYPGPIPRTTLVRCDIERVLERHCATDADKAMGIRLADAAIALNEGQTSAIGLDDSPAALARCGGEPEAVPYIGAFPEGQSTCVNGSWLGDPAHFATPSDVCVLLCEDGFGSTAADGTLVPDNPPGPGVASFCTAHASASTNLPGDPNPGFAGGCTPDGSESPDFDSATFLDPRRNPEPVVWGDLVGVSAAGNSLTRTLATTGNFDAGASATAQRISRGDAYLEFGGAQTNLSHVAGLSAIVAGCPSPGGCPPDSDPSLADINFSISLNFDGRYYVIESGVLIVGPDVNGSFGTYSASDRFRVTLHDHSDGTADVAYSKLVGACTPRTVCAETVFRTVTGSPAHYPLRVDTTFREAGATLTSVTLVRIH